MKKHYSLCFVAVLLFAACTQTQSSSAPLSAREAAVLQNLDGLKKNAAPGDLVVRLGDDLLSYQIRFMNEKEQLWSHAGIVMEMGGKKVVAHITPDEAEKDGIQYAPIDSFLAPQKNLSCALYRYDFTPAERDSFVATINGFHSSGMHFDRLYQLNTDSTMYCSEMISKAARMATHGRLQFRECDIPPKMLPSLYRFFEKEASKEAIAARKIMTIDNLYRMPQCRLVMQFPLKFLPGQ